MLLLWRLIVWFGVFLSVMADLGRRFFYDDVTGIVLLCLLALISDPWNLYVTFWSELLGGGIRDVGQVFWGCVVSVVGLLVLVGYLWGLAHLLGGRTRRLA